MKLKRTASNFWKFKLCKRLKTFLLKIIIQRLILWIHSIIYFIKKKQLKFNSIHFKYIKKSNSNHFTYLLIKELFYNFLVAFKPKIINLWIYNLFLDSKIKIKESKNNLFYKDNKHAFGSSWIYTLDWKTLIEYQFA